MLQGFQKEGALLGPPHLFFPQSKCSLQFPQNLTLQLSGCYTTYTGCHKKKPILSHKKPAFPKIQILVQIGRRLLGPRTNGPPTIELLQLVSATTELLCWFDSCQRRSSPKFRSSLWRQGVIKKNGWGSTVGGSIHMVPRKATLDELRAIR